MLCCCPMLCFMHTCATNTNIVGCTNTFQRTQLWRPLEWHVIGLKCNQCKTTFEEWACLYSHLRVYVQLGWFRVCFCHPSLLQGQAVQWPSKLLLQLVMIWWWCVGNRAACFELSEYPIKPLLQLQRWRSVILLTFKFLAETHLPSSQVAATADEDGDDFSPIR